MLVIKIHRWTAIALVALASSLVGFYYYPLITSFSLLILYSIGVTIYAWIQHDLVCDLERYKDMWFNQQLQKEREELAAETRAAAATEKRNGFIVINGRVR